MDMLLGGSREHSPMVSVADYKSVQLCARKFELRSDQFTQLRMGTVLEELSPTC